MGQYVGYHGETCRSEEDEKEDDKVLTLYTRASVQLSMYIEAP